MPFFEFIKWNSIQHIVLFLCEKWEIPQWEQKIWSSQQLITTSNLKYLPHLTSLTKRQGTWTLPKISFGWGVGLGWKILQRTFERTTMGFGRSLLINKMNVIAWLQFAMQPVDGVILRLDCMFFWNYSSATDTIWSYIPTYPILILSIQLRETRLQEGCEPNGTCENPLLNYRSHPKCLIS